MLQCNRKRRSSCALAAAFVVTLTHTAFTPSAHAGNIIYDNNVGGAAGIGTVILSDLDNSSGGIFRINADDFTLDSGTAIVGIQWAGIYAPDNTPPATDDFTIAIYADTGGGSPQGGAPQSVARLLNPARVLTY